MERNENLGIEIAMQKFSVIKAVFSEIPSQDMSSSFFLRKTKLLIGRPARLVNQNLGFWREKA